MTDTLHIVVLAAGAGKRMRSSLPKVLQPLAGRPLLAHVLDTAAELGPSATTVVHGHLGEQVRAAFADRPGLDWAEQAEQLGTGHAVMQAMGRVDDDATVLVLCGDVPLLRAETLTPLVAAAADTLAVLTVDLPDATGYGRIVRDASDRVLRIVEERDADQAVRAIREINTGVIAAPARRLRGWLDGLSNDNAQGEYYLTDAVELAVADGLAVAGVRCDAPDEVQGINDRVQLAEAEAAYRRRAARKLLAEGATLADPARVDVRGRVSVGRDVYIDVNAVLEGDVHLGDGVHLEPQVVLRDVSLGAGTRVKANSVLERCRTGEDCELGPFLRLRPGTELGDRVKLGNFVEVKATRFGDGSKAGHLSYLGDATVGRDVNIGAGTIVCNYDGAAKHHTEIGDDAFIGSGVELVAPVRVGAGATIGAGSTVSREAPDGQLTVARARQTTVAGWKRPVKKT